MRGFSGYAVGLCAIIGLVAADAGANGRMYWSFQDTQYTQGNVLALAMRDGQAWPVIITDGASGVYGTAISLFPVGGQSGSGSWKTIGSGLFTAQPYRTRAVSTPERFAFAASGYNGPAYSAGGKVSLPGGGWSGLPDGTKAVAFAPNGSLVTVNATSGPYGYTPMGTAVDVAVSPTGAIGVVSAASATINSSFWYSEYNPWVGRWVGTEIALQGLYGDSIDLEFDGKGRPHIVGAAYPTSGSNWAIWSANFDTMSGKWVKSVLEATAKPSLPALAVNASGTLGTAYIDDDGSLVYAYKTDNADWTSTIVTTNTAIGTGVAFAYDYAGLPVIAYRGPTSVMLAYDPISTPEPATGLLLMGLAAVLMRRRAA